MVWEHNLFVLCRLTIAIEQVTANNVLLLPFIFYSITVRYTFIYKST